MTDANGIIQHIWKYAIGFQEPQQEVSGYDGSKITITVDATSSQIQGALVWSEVGGAILVHLACSAQRLALVTDVD